MHRTYNRSIAQSTRIEIGEHVFAAMTPDPLVLFPGAEIACTTDITLAATARAIVTDGLAHHDRKEKAVPSVATATPSSCATPRAPFCSPTVAPSPAN